MNSDICDLSSAYLIIYYSYTTARTKVPKLLIGKLSAQLTALCTFLCMLTEAIRHRVLSHLFMILFEHK